MNDTRIISSNTTKSILSSTWTVTHIPSYFLVQADTCEQSHSHHYCNYISACILLGYVCRPFIMPFLLYRIEKLNFNLRSDYNFSLSWLWTVASVAFIDLLEYYVSKPQYNAYSSFINFFNLLHLLFTLVVILRFMTFYGFSKTNYSNMLISMCFLATWFSLIILRKSMQRHNDSHMPPLVIYLTIYMLFGGLQVFKNVSNETARCLTHASFAFYLTSCFFLSSYQIVLNGRYFEYIHYKNFFEIGTLVVILLQNIYYGDSKYEHHSIPSKEEPLKKINRLKERSNSGVLYFQDKENQINGERILNKINSRPEDDELFDTKIYLNNSKDSPAPPALSIVDKNDEIQNETVVYEETIAPTNELKFREREKTGIFFSYIPSVTWKAVLAAFCIVYYSFAFITLFRAVHMNFFLILCPSFYPFIILCAILYKKFIKRKI